MKQPDEFSAVLGMGLLTLTSRLMPVKNRQELMQAFFEVIVRVIEALRIVSESDSDPLQDDAVYLLDKIRITATYGDIEPD